MKKSRFAVILTAASILLCSCGIIKINKKNGNTDGLETKRPPYEAKEYETYQEEIKENEAQTRLDALEGYDFNGRSIFIAVCSETGDIFNDEKGTYSSTVYRRNSMVADKYNCRILSIQKNEKTVLSEVSKSEKNGSYYADFAVIRSAQLGSWYIGSHLRNAASLSNLDLTAEYFDKYACEQLSPGKAIYGIVGDAVKSVEKFACMYVNKDILSDTGVELDYGKIADGGLTWDDVLSYCRKSVDGATGFVSSFNDETIADYGFFSAGQTYMSKNEKGKFRLSCDNDATEKLAGYLHELCTLKTESLKVNKDEKNTALTGFDIFASGNAAVCFGSVGDMSRLADCGFRWEVLPLPKVTAEQEKYGTAITESAPVMGVLVNVSDIDTVGYVLQGLNAASGGFVDYDFYRTAMREYITGNYTLDMLDLIADNPIYDMASMFYTTSSAVKDGTMTAFRSAVKNGDKPSNYFAKKQDALNKYIDALK